MKRRYKQLTQDQQAFAVQNHALLCAFLYRHRLSEDYYGPLSIRYLKTVQLYLMQDNLQRYAFSTVLWYHLRSELSHIYRDLEKEWKVLPLYEDQCPAPEKAYAEANALWAVLEDALTEKQMEILQLRCIGLTRREIAERCGITTKAVSSRLERLQKKAKRILSNNEGELL